MQQSRCVSNALDGSRESDLDPDVVLGFRSMTDGIGSEATASAIISGRTRASRSQVATLRFARVGRLMLLVHGQRAPSPEGWSAWVEAFANAAAEHGVRALLVVSQGGGPNARQRKEVVEALVVRLGAAVDEMATAVCGSAPTVRAITAAIGWLSGAPRMRSFASDAQHQALEYLKVPKVKRPEILLVTQKLEAELRTECR